MRNCMSPLSPKVGLTMREYLKDAVFAAGEIQSGCTLLHDQNRKSRSLFSKSAASAYAKRDAALP